MQNLRARYTHSIGQFVSPAPDVVSLVAKDVGDKHHSCSVGLVGNSHVSIQATCSKARQDMTQITV